MIYDLDPVARIIGYCIMAAGCIVGVLCVFVFLIDQIWRRIQNAKDGTNLVREFAKWKRGKR